MSKTFNLYCDESCHIENDHKKYMLLAYVSSAYNLVAKHTACIKQIKEKHHFYGEIKWSNVSSSQYLFYEEVIDYFFQNDLNFRAVIIDKNKIKTTEFNQDYDTFYYKMYYYLLNHNIDTSSSYNVYLDIKDSLSAHKVSTLNDILNTKFGVFRSIQNIRSHESLLLQIADLIMGALAYNLNDSDKKVTAKIDLIEMISKQTKRGLKQTSSLNDSKINLFFINLQ